LSVVGMLWMNQTPGHTFCSRWHPVSESRRAQEKRGINERGHLKRRMPSGHVLFITSPSSTSSSYTHVAHSHMYTHAYTHTHTPTHTNKQTNTHAHTQR